MPIYTFRNLETDQVFEETMSFSDLEGFLEEHPQYKQVFKPINIGYNFVSKKQPDSWKDVLNKAKGAHKNNTIES